MTHEVPADTGMDPRALSDVVNLVEARRARAQLCVLRDGNVVLDRSWGCRPDDLFWTFSAGKPFVALLVHLLAERGEVDLDAPVADHWPAFGQAGKDAITIRQVLRHRAGLPVARSLIRDALVITDWRRSTLEIERARPLYPPGQVPAYHILSFGFILGELVQRLTGEPVARVLESEFLRPLGLGDTYLGLPDAAWPRHVPLTGSGSSWLRGAFFNRRAVRQAVVPAAGVSSTARDLAFFYEALRLGGEREGVRVLKAATLEAARWPTADGEIDRFLKRPIRWAEGFQLGNPDPDRPRAMGRTATRTTFGHNGSSTCIAWADPQRRLVLAYMTDRATTPEEGTPHQGRVADAVIAACA